jgi:hypothetical protein
MSQFGTDFNGLNTLYKIVAIDRVCAVLSFCVVAKIRTAHMSSPLDGFQLEPEWAEDNHIDKRTSARYRAQGLLDYMIWGGRVWISIASGHDLIRSRIKRRNPRRQRRQAATPTEIRT